MTEDFFPNKPGRAALHKVDLTGDYESTIYDVARRLLAEGANPRDQVETYRGGVLSMAGSIGWLAKWTVEFATNGPRLKAYRGCVGAPLAGKSDVQATQVAETAEFAVCGGNGHITRGVSDGG